MSTDSAESTVRQTAAGSQSAPESFTQYREGCIYQPIGRKIQELIMAEDDYIVFLDEFGGVQWAHTELKRIATKDYDVVCNKVAELEVRSRFLREDGGPPPDRADSSAATPPNVAGGAPVGGSTPDFATYQHKLFSGRRLIAEGMARLLDSGSIEAASGILDTAEKWIAQRSAEASRRWFLGRFAILASVALITALGIILWQCWARAASPVGSDNIALGLPVLLVSSTLLGGLGAFVSASLLNRKIPFDATAGRKLHYLEAYMRFGIGLVGGLLVILLIQSGVILSTAAVGSGGNSALCLVFSLLAGGSELFLPTLLSRFDDSLQRQTQQTTQPPPANGP